MRSPDRLVDGDDRKPIGALARHHMRDVDAALLQLAADPAAVVIVADGAEIAGASGQSRRTPTSPSPSARRHIAWWLEMRSLAVGLSALGRARAAGRRD